MKIKTLSISILLLLFSCTEKQNLSKKLPSLDRIPVIIEENDSIKLKNEDKNDEPITEKELLARLDTLSYNPNYYKDRFKYKNGWTDKILKEIKPEIYSEVYWRTLDSLTLDEYYEIFQKQLHFRLYSFHPYYFLAYEEKEKYYKFYIYQWVEAKYTAIYLVHLAKSGKKLFNEMIYCKGGDGGYWFKTIPEITTNKLKLEISEGTYEYDGIHDGKPVTESKKIKIIEFDGYGKVKI